jgi:hypothetical protein
MSHAPPPCGPMTTMPVTDSGCQAEPVKGRYGSVPGDTRSDVSLRRDRWRLQHFNLVVVAYAVARPCALGFDH